MEKNETPKTTTIKIKSETLSLLRAFQIHPRETHEQIILRLLDDFTKKVRCPRCSGTQVYPLGKKGGAMYEYFCEVCDLGFNPPEEKVKGK